MTEFLLGAAAFVLGTVALGLIRLLRGPGHADRMLAAQLLGTGGVAALLLLGVATGVGAIVEVALLLALLAAFASVAFVSGIHRPDGLGTASGTEHAAPGSSDENKRDTP
ncbi:sodium:proton antiporter [Thiocystis minor]|uniref:monovalent cation/H+ antiporter complex subunit F n=1 Tax=Thiocystis minor TaxID=61597 RepID=UPI001914B083|nr:monovalent cation/H+ antiporter complex subunit F [Thiocystis minor]MBK5962673.1 sodium:proton antiporter [Thiocystis minor]